MGLHAGGAGGAGAGRAGGRRAACEHSNLTPSACRRRRRRRFWAGRRVAREHQTLYSDTWLCLQAAQEAQVLGGPTGAVRHASTPLPGARGGLQPAQFDPSAVFGAAAAQSFDNPWPGPSGDATAGGSYEGPSSGEEPGGDSLGALEGGGPGLRGDSGSGGGVQRRTESEPVAAFARRAPRPVLREFVALGLGHAASAEAAAARWGFPGAACAA